MLIIVMFRSYSLSHFSFSTWTFIFFLCYFSIDTCSNSLIFHLNIFSLFCFTDYDRSCWCCTSYLSSFLTLPSLFGQRHSFLALQGDFSSFFNELCFSPLAHVLLHAPAKNRNKRFFMINFRTHKGERERRMREKWGIFCVVSAVAWRERQRGRVAGERYANGFDESTECVCVWATEQRASRWLAGFDEKMNGKNMVSVGESFFKPLVMFAYASIHGTEPSHWKQHTTARSKKRRGKKSICKFIHLIKT